MGMAGGCTATHTVAEAGIRASSSELEQVNAWLLGVVVERGREEPRTKRWGRVQSLSAVARMRRETT